MHGPTDKRTSLIKKWNRLLASFLLVALTFSALSGCSKSGGSDSGGTGDSDSGAGGTSGKGRYIEEDMGFPLRDGEEALNLTSTKDGKLVLFASLDDNRIKRYEYNGQQWEETTLDWFSQIYTETTVVPLEVQETADGIQYVRGMEESSQTHIARGGDGSSGEDIPIPYLSQQGELGYPIITGMIIDSKENCWLQNPYESKIVVIAGDTMESIEEIGTTMSFSMMQRLIYQGQGTIALNTEEDEYTIYNEDREQQGTFSVKRNDQSWICSDGDHWYLISGDGITRLTVGNDTQEVIMDGSMGAMGSTVNTPAGAVIGQEDDFYILYYQDKAGTNSLKHYVYDPEATAVPEQILQVFGLTDSDTVREAAMGFQKAHPNVKVEFTTSGKQAGEVTSDDIRTLNTELLSGNGADVLLLDGLPKDAYIEKGILADLSETAEELMKADAYLEPLLKNTAQKDGKIYGLPIKFSVPIIFGNEDAKKALESLDSLKAFLENDPEASVFGIADRDYIRDFLFQMYQGEIFGEDGKVDQEKLAALLELEGQIAVNAKASLFDVDAEVRSEGSYTKDPFSNVGSEGLINHPEGAATTSISSISEMLLPYTVMREKGLTPDTIQGYYQPKGIVAVDQNTDQTETAVEFVKYLFSQEVQSAQLDDGFPVLKSALQDKKNEADSEYASSYYMMSSWNFEGEEIMLEAGFPTVEEVEDLIRLCGDLDTPAEQERIIWNLYQEEADQYLGGTIDAKTAAENIARKVDTYLAE